jgi:hypothetical protein
MLPTLLPLPAVSPPSFSMRWVTARLFSGLARSETR